MSCILAVTIPACVVERKGPIESLKRSFELTKGHRLQIFVLYLIVGVITGIVTAIFVLLFGIFAAIFGTAGIVIAALLLAIILAVPQAFNSVMTTVIYSDLRQAKEGVALDSLANVFD